MDDLMSAAEECGWLDPGYLGGPSIPDWVTRSAMFFSRSSMRLPISSSIVQ